MTRPFDGPPPMPMPQGAIQYRCTCGALYLIALQETPDEQWVETVRTVARSLRAAVIDGSEPCFTCRGCGQVQLRSGIAAPPVELTSSALA
jgi:hypothetical protein